MATKRGRGTKRGTTSGVAEGVADGTRNDGEFPKARKFRTALISGNNFRIKAVRYADIEGMAMFEGDIVLGTVAQVEATTRALAQESSGAVALGVVIPGAARHWPNCRVPYTIDAGLPNQARVTGAIAHWETNTSYRFVARTTEADYVTFRPGGGCSSSVGRQGGQQFVNLGPNCTQGNCIHEIGHTVGLWHEQSREDRDQFVTIHWDKIEAGLEHNFDQHITDGDDVGAYDYGSIMHYPRDAFSIDGSDTITPVDSSASIGQRLALSAGDIAAAASLCTAGHTLKENPNDTLKEAIKDGIADTRKELVKDVRFDTRKELIRDTQKELVKDPIKDGRFDPPTIKEGVFDPGPTIAEQPVTPGRPPFRPGGFVPGMGASPFAVATQPQAPAGGGGGDQSIEELDQALQALADQIMQVEASRASLQAQYDEMAALLQKLLADSERGTS